MALNPLLSLEEERGRSSATFLSSEETIRARPRAVHLRKEMQVKSEKGISFSLCEPCLCLLSASHESEGGALVGALQM